MTTQYIELPVKSEAEATSGYEINGQWRWILECSVDPDGTVCVRDEIANHYTRCHSLTESQIAEVRRLASM